MIARLTLLAVLLLSAPFCGAVSAQAIGPRFDAIPDGFAVVYRMTGGAVTSAVHEGWTDDGYRVTLHRGGKGAAGALLDTRFYDRNGNLVRYETPVETWTYAPHDCSRVIGRCRYAATNETSGATFHWTRDTRRVGGREYEFSNNLDGERRASGGFRLGENRLTIAFNKSEIGDAESRGMLLRFIVPR